MLFSSFCFYWKVHIWCFFFLLVCTIIRVIKGSRHSGFFFLRVVVAVVVRDDVFTKPKCTVIFVVGGSAPVFAP